jgi:hypothetical protein
MQGTLKYATYKSLVTKPDMSEDEKEFANLIFGYNKELNQYYFDENHETAPELDKMIALLQDGDRTMEKLAAGETLAVLTATEEAVPTALPVPEKQPISKIVLMGIILVAILGIGGISLVVKRREVPTNTTTL